LVVPPAAALRPAAAWMRASHVVFVFLGRCPKLVWGRAFGAKLAWWRGRAAGVGGPSWPCRRSWHWMVAGCRRGWRGGNLVVSPAAAHSGLRQRGCVLRTRRLFSWGDAPSWYGAAPLALSGAMPCALMWPPGVSVVWDLGAMHRVGLGHEAEPAMVTRWRMCAVSISVARVLTGRVLERRGLGGRCGRGGLRRRGG
jgi:hypothetical protein